MLFIFDVDYVHIMRIMLIVYFSFCLKLNNFFTKSYSIFFVNNLLLIINLIINAFILFID